MVEDSDSHDEEEAREKKESDDACSALKDLINQDHLVKLLDYLESDDELQIMYVLI